MCTYRVRTSIRRMPLHLPKKKMNDKDDPACTVTQGEYRDDTEARIAALEARVADLSRLLSEVAESSSVMGAALKRQIDGVQQATVSLLEGGKSS